MNIFEFYFNPKETKKNFFCKHIAFLPKNIYEEKIGPLFLFIVLKSFSLKEKFFVEEFTRFVKKEFYKKQGRTILIFKEGLKKINEFLEEKNNEGVPLLGNLEVSLANIKGKNFVFSKVGLIDFFLLRNKRVFNLHRKIKIKKQKNSYPFFNHIFATKIFPTDFLFVMPKALSSLFEKEKLWEEIKKKPSLKEIDLRRIFYTKKEKMKKALGLCLVFDFSLPDTFSSLPRQTFLFFLRNYEFPFFFYEIQEKIKKKKELLLILLFLLVLFSGLILFS